MDINKEKIQTQEDVEVETLSDEGCKLMLHNDDYHTFDYVIKALVDICRHSLDQAQQCAILTHCKGKCVIKKGAYEELLPLHTAMLEKQLTTEIIK